jgi:hypothetical protein
VPPLPLAGTRFARDAPWQALKNKYPSQTHSKKKNKKKIKEKMGQPVFYDKKIEAARHLDRNQTRFPILPCLLLLRAVAPPASLP